MKARLNMNLRYRAFACGCGHLWLDAPRHYTCADCGRLIGEIDLADARVVDHLRHERAQGGQRGDRMSPENVR